MHLRLRWLMARPAQRVVRPSIAEPLARVSFCATHGTSRLIQPYRSSCPRQHNGHAGKSRRIRDHLGHRVVLGYVTGFASLARSPPGHAGYPSANAPYSTTTPQCCDSCEATLPRCPSSARASHCCALLPRQSSRARGREVFEAANGYRTRLSLP